MRDIGAITAGALVAEGRPMTIGLTPGLLAEGRPLPLGSVG